MRLNEVTYGTGLPVDGYGPGFFRIGGEVVRGNCLILPGGVRPWGGLEDAAGLLAAACAIDIVFVGTGAEICHLPGAFRQALEAAGVGVEAMASPVACRTYNILLSEGRRVGLAALAL